MRRREEGKRKMVDFKGRAAKASTPAVRIAHASVIALMFALAVAVSVDPAWTQTASTAPNSNRVFHFEELTKAPKKDADRSNPMASDPDAVAAGAKLFDLHCNECHGENAHGKKKGPSMSAPEVRQATPGTLFWLLTNGVVRKGMPVWSKLPEPQRWQIVTYIKSLPKPNTTARLNADSDFWSNKKSAR
jgi:mono/diheme cytochrome c family protein